MYPGVCPGCTTREKEKSHYLCFECESQTPTTDHMSIRDNLLERKIFGRVELNFGAALYIFSKNTPVQKLIHALKYKGQKNLGIRLGMRMGAQMARALPREVFPDLIVPIPLSPGKRRSRGYNQAAMFAQGIGMAIERPVESNLLLKSKDTISQTQINRHSRFQNVFKSFELNNNFKIRDHTHILIVDDVFTTGATIEAAAHRLGELHQVRLSIAVIATGI